MGTDPQATPPHNLLNDAVDTGQSFFSLLREIAIVVLVVLLLAKPAVLKDRLMNAGVTHLDLGAVQVDVSADSKKAASVVSDVNLQLTDVESGLADLAKRYPGAGTEIQSLETQVQGLQSQATTADQSLKASLLTQQAAQQAAAQQAAAQPSSAQPAAAQAAQSTGWLYVGQVDATQTKWAGVGAKCVDPSRSPKFSPGDKIVVTTTVFLHGNPPAGQWHTAGDVQSAVPAQTQFEVEDSDYSHAKFGGFFLWLKVKRAS